MKQRITEQSGMTKLSFEITGDVAVVKSLVPKLNGFHFLIPVEVIERAGGYLLTYDAGSLLTLSKYLRLSPLGTADVNRLLLGISRPLCEARQNGIYQENFSYDPDHIFIDFQSKKLKLIYFPFETGVNANQVFKTLISTLVTELIVTNGEDPGHMVKIMDCYKQAGFTIRSFTASMERLAEEGGEKKRKPGFWSWVFGKKAQPLVSQPVHQPEILNETILTPVAPKLQGTELLIPDTDYDGGQVVRSVSLGIEAGGMVSETEVKSFPCILGRSPTEANVVLDDKSVSRRHAVIDCINESFSIMDEHSSNGVMVNGTKLVPGEIHSLSTGDTLRVGRVTVRITNMEGV